MSTRLQEHDILVRRLRDGGWEICQRHDSRDQVIDGPFPDRIAAAIRARTLAERAQSNAFLEETADALQLL